jgi:hypothetical protein
LRACSATSTKRCRSPSAGACGAFDELRFLEHAGSRWPRATSSARRLPPRVPRGRQPVWRLIARPSERTM